MSKVSVIMPSLNIVDYIEQAVSSVINQTLKDIEIICIDAGSDDGTWEQLEKFAKNDERIVIVRSNRRSYGYQVNLGLKIASGEYVAVVETDDYIEANMYELLYKVAVENDCDYVKADYKAFWTQKDGQKVYLNRKNLSDERIYNQIICPREYPALGGDDWYLWTGIYKTNFIKKNSIEFTESRGAAFQDVGFLIKTLQKAKRALYINDYLYNYCIDRETSSSNQNKSLIYSYAEYKINIDDERLTVAEQKLFYARMIRSFWLCLKDIKHIDNSNKMYIDWFIEKLSYAINKGYVCDTFVSNNIIQSVKRMIENADCYLAEKKADEITKLDALKTTSKCKNIIFGCGNYGYEAYQWSKRNNILIGGFMDNNKALWDTMIDELPVFSPDMCTQLEKGTMYIIANEKYADQIMKQLIGMEIEEKYILKYI